MRAQGVKMGDTGPMKGWPAPFFTLFDGALAPHVMYTGP
jgi:hypothetical protein